MEGKLPRGRPRARWIHQIRKDIEMRGENWEKFKKIGTGRMETPGDFPVIVDLYT